VPRTSKQLREEIEARLGFFPTFFESALVSPPTLENLWQQTITADIENPLAPLLKGLLNLSAIPDALPALGVLPVPTRVEAISPIPDSPLERTLLGCAAAILEERGDSSTYQEELRRLLGPDLFSHLAVYLSYLRACHLWMEMHPEISAESGPGEGDPQGSLLAEGPALAGFFQRHRERGQEKRSAENSLTEEAFSERTRLIALAADIGCALSAYNSMIAMLQGCTEALVKHLNAAFARIWTLNEAENMLELHASSGLYTHLDGPHGRVPVGQFKIGLIAQECKPHLTNSVSGDPRVGDQDWAKREGMVAFAGYPLIVDQRVVGVTAMFSRHPLSELTLQAIGSVADQIAMGIERKRIEEALRESEARFRLMANAIPHIAWTTHSDGSVDYYNDRWYEYSGLTFEQTRNWGWEAAIHPDDLANAGGVWQTAIASGSISKVEYRIKRADGEYRWHLGRSEPIRDEAGQIISWVGTATDISERKAAELTQAALFEHEHRIASQLQAALQPNLPGAVSGLKVRKYYEAALAEAGVGGDFFDVFAMDKGCTALIVGDLSGKGLAAAAQVSTVRNMLRAFLYSKPDLAQAVNDLNSILADNSLLEGFATLFVGVYDSGTRMLKYVNCGQEPALVRRAATGQSEELLPTGPIMGSLETAYYTAETLKLEPGDAIAVFTDGLTEVGPSRLNMLGIEGVAALFERSLSPEEVDDPDEAAEQLMLRLIAGVDSYAQGGIRDDMCLLVGVVT